MRDWRPLPSDVPLAYHIDWSAHHTQQCVETGWRVLPYWVVLHVGQGGYHCRFAEPEHRRSVTARPGEVLMVPAGARHALTFEPHTAVDGLHIEFRLHHDLDVFSLYRVPDVITPENAPRVGATVAALTATLARQDIAGVTGLVARHAAAYGFLDAALNASRPLPDRGRRLQGLGRLQAALRLIEERLDDPPGTEELAATCSLSRNRFGLLFKEAIGVSPKTYIDQRRLRQAMSLLMNGEDSIAEIADRLGFCDPYHFSKRFKGITGESPRDYRRKIRETLLR